LRFFLAFWVILHHITGKGMMMEAWSQSLPPMVQSLLRGGYLAVQTFFILSGFVLARSYAETRWNRNSLIRFGMARFARVYPVYALSLVVISRFVLETFAKPDRTIPQKIALLGDYVFVLLGWMGSRSVGWNTPAWSLTCEIFFYLCFPLLFLWLRKGSLPRILTALSIALVTPVLLAHAGVPAVWKPIHHLSDFLAGIAAAALYEMLSRNVPALVRRGYVLYVPALAAFLALITHPRVLNGTYADLNTALRPLNVALLIGLAFGDKLLARLLSVKSIEYLGKASYSMYILHVPILWWFSRFGLHMPGPEPHLLNGIAYLCFVIGLSILAFEKVETPANDWLRNWTAERLRQPAESRAAFMPEPLTAQA
jgi:peptidoglycan/LPS O-acetylase OafA/YrhL